MKYKSIPGLKARYSISKEGVVYSSYANKVRVIVPLLNKWGYLQICLDDNFGKRRCMRVHRLVALTYLEPSKDPTFTEVNHNDGNKLNNHVSNLEWANHSINVKHAYDTGLVDKSKLHKRLELARSKRRVAI